MRPYFELSFLFVSAGAISGVWLNRKGFIASRKSYNARMLFVLNLVVRIHGWYQIHPNRCRFHANVLSGRPFGHAAPSYRLRLRDRPFIIF